MEETIEGSATRKLSLAERTLSLLAGLRTATEAASDSEVVRHALVIYEQLVDDLQHHRQVLVRDRHGADVEIKAHVSDKLDASPPPPKLVKRNVVLPKATARRIDALVEATHAQSHSEVIRDAIEVYDQLVSAVQNGVDIVVRDLRSDREYYRTLAIPRAKRAASSVGRLGQELARALTL